MNRRQKREAIQAVKSMTDAHLAGYLRNQRARADKAQALYAIAEAESRQRVRDAMSRKAA